MTQARVALIMAGATGGHVFPALAVAKTSCRSITWSRAAARRRPSAAAAAPSLSPIAAPSATRSRNRRPNIAVRCANGVGCVNALHMVPGRHADVCKHGVWLESLDRIQQVLHDQKLLR